MARYRTRGRYVFVWSLLFCGWLGKSLSQQLGAEALEDLPLVFEPNLGQTDPQVRFLTRAVGMTSFLTGRENVMVLSRRKGGPEAPEIERTVVRMMLDGARLPVRFEALEKAVSVSNYFTGRDPSKWKTNVPHYRKLRARGVYPGIDLVYYGDGGKLEYDFVVKAGADPGRIRLAYRGAESLATDAEGNLLITTALGTLVQRKPVVYQQINGERRKVEASYSIRAGRIEFALADWDRRHELVIDPVLVYSTYLGGSGTDYGTAITVDASGAAYITGYTSSSNFPTTSGVLYPTTTRGDYDAFITKLNVGGSALVFSTYLGGAGADYGEGIALDANGAVYVTGNTASSDFPVTAGAFQMSFGGGAYDAFVTKLSGAGNALLYSTYLGGNAEDTAAGITVDSSGAAYVTGTTYSTNFPTSGAYQSTNAGSGDAFVTKLSATGSALVYSTFLGGSAEDNGLAIAIDASNAAYVAGRTISTNFPIVSAFQTVFGGGTSDAFVTKLNATGGAAEYSTYLGGSGFDYAYGIAVDSSLAAYVTGGTASTNFPTLGAFQSVFGGTDDAFVTKLSSTGGALVYSTYLGGAGDDIGYHIAVDTSGAAYVTGRTASIPTTTCAFQTSFGGTYDAFVSKLNPAGNALVYSTFLGGSGAEIGLGLAVDTAGVYVTGYTASSNFPVSTGAYQTALVPAVSTTPL
jgi:hypothetical protein